MNRPYILVSNDDSINAKGIHALIDFLAPIAQIVVVAPDAPRSGQSSAITVGTTLHVMRHPDYNGAKMFAVNGTPVDCVKLGLHSIVERRPDLVVAGINHGPNSGNCVIYSGTMGAVIEGATVGIPSVGFSLLDWHADADFSECRETVVRITESILAGGLPHGVCLNVNIPAHCTPKGVRCVRAARGHWTEEYDPIENDPSGLPSFRLGGRFLNEEPDCDSTDEYWLSRQWATAVPVAVDQTAVAAIPEVAEILGV